jgi:hypothetical protein
MKMFTVDKYSIYNLFRHINYNFANCYIKQAQIGVLNIPRRQ